MIVGIGVDTTTISRIEKSLQSSAFLHKVYGNDELALLQSKTGKAHTECAATNWAAKEALFKALGTGLFSFSLQQAQILRTQNGAPYFAFTGELAQHFIQNGYKAHVSATHEGLYATAFVVIEKEQ